MPRVSEHELEARLPFLPHIQEIVRAAVRQMQQEGILDLNGQLIPPKALSEDMREGSNQECQNSHEPATRL